MFSGALCEIPLCEQLLAFGWREAVLHAPLPSGQGYRRKLVGEYPDFEIEVHA